MAVIKILGVDVHYEDYEALSNITLDVSPGEVVSIIGPNGSGKTTLLKTIDKIVKPFKGSILIDGKNINKLNWRELAKKVGYCPQRVNTLGTTTVIDFVLTGRRPYVNFAYSKLDYEKAYDALRMVNCCELAFRRLDQLSGGELQRVLIARAIVAEPKVLLMDEPTSSLDPRYQVEILELVKKFSRTRNLSVIMSLHDLTHAYRFSDKIVVLKRGRIIAAGRPSEVLTEEIILKAFDVKAKVLEDLKAVVIESVV
ncbi:MAG: ABC transporter ATP-binding protein [Thermosphaera sp.]